MIGPNLSELAVRERAVTLFFILAIAGAGLLAFLQLGRAEDPSFTIKAMTISAAWPGATAEEMQDEVADRLEKRLQELRWFDRVETQARPGVVTMTVSLVDKTPPASVPDQWYQVRKKLSDEARNLPRGVIGPFFNDEYSDVYFSLYALTAPGMPPRRLLREAEGLRERLLALPGVKKVNIIGEQPERIYVDIPTARLATLGIAATDIFASVGSQNAVASAGTVETGGPSVSVRAEGAFDSVEQVAAVPIAAGGRGFRIGDIARVRRGYEDPASYLVRHDGVPALMLGVIMRERYDGLALGRELAAETGAIRGALPLGIGFEQVADQAHNIDEAYGEFMLKFAVALSVIMIVSLVSLGWRVGLVVAAAVPLTLAMVFVVMLITGRDFDRITLGALILSLGLLVDDAIIAIEMMVVKMSEGMDRVRAATFAWGATAAPMLAGTLVTVIGFLPIGFARSSAGEYAGNIFWIVGFALIASWIVAVYFTPYLGVKLLPAIEPVAGGHEAIYATSRYERLRRWVSFSVTRRRPVVFVTLAALVISGLLIGVAVPKQFFPASQRPEVLIEVSLPKGSAIGATTRSVEALERFLRAQPEAQTIDSYVGGGAPRFFLSLNPELPDSSFAKVVVNTADGAARDALSAKVRAAWAEGRFPAARIRVSRLLFGPPVPYPVAFRVVGADPDIIRPIAERVARIVSDNAQTRDVHLDWGERTPTVRLAFDQDRLRRIGLTPADASRQIGAQLSGLTIAQVREGTRIVDVVARAGEGDRGRLDRLAGLNLRTSAGSNVPLAGVATLVPAFENPILKRRNRATAITVRADIVRGVQPPDVTAAILPALAKIEASVPPDVLIQTGGAVEESGRANKALAPIFPVMLLLMLAVIMIQVRSFGLAALVFATAPLGMIGAALALLLTGMPFGFNAILGLIGLAGILMRNTLILIDQIRIERAAGAGEREAVIEATVRRARPVVLTALAAILAFIPLSFSTFWGPLAVVLIGGVIVGTALTLFFLPALYAMGFVPGARASRIEREPQPRFARLRRIDPRIAVLALATFATGTEAYVYAGLLSDVAGDLGVTIARTGLLASAFAITYAVLAPFLASLTAAVPRRTLLVGGLAAIGVVNIAASFAPSFGWLLASRVLCGVVAAIIGPAATAMAAALVEENKRGAAMATVGAGISLAFTVGVPLGSAVGGAFGWRATFVFAGLLLFVAATLVRFVLPSVPTDDRAGLATLNVVRRPAIAGRLAFSAFAFTATFSSVAYIGPIVNRVTDLYGAGVGIFQALTGVGSIIGIVLGGRLADTVARDRYLPGFVGAVVVTQLGYVAAQLLPPGALAGLVLGVSIVSGAAMLFAGIPIIQVGLVGAAPDRRNVALALNGSMIFLGQGMGAAVGGWIVGSAGLTWTGVAGASIALLVSGMATILLAPRRSGALVRVG